MQQRDFNLYNVFMNIFIKGTGLDLTGPLKVYIEDKIGSLGRLLGRVDSETIQVQVEIARSTQHHRHGEVYRAEVNMQLPKGVLRAEEDNADARAAIDMVKDKLQREIETYLSKHGKDHREHRATEKEK